MDCREVQENLSAYYDDVLEVKDKKLIEEHLNNCSNCREELESLKQISEILKEAPPVSVPDGFAEEVIQRINQDKIKPIGKKTRKLTSWQIVLPGVAALLLATFIGISLKPAAMNQELVETKMMDQFIANDQGAAKENSAFDGATGAGEGFSVRGSEADMARQESAEMKSEVAPMEPNALTLPDQELNPEASRKVIQNGYLRLEVSNLEGTMDKIAKEVTASGGHVQNSSMYEDEFNGIRKPTRGHLTLRVPSDTFEKVFKDLKGLGRVTFQETSGQDVTTEYVDLEARKANWLAQEARLREILDSAKNVDEILKVEKELARVRQELEVMEARLKNLNNLTQLATINIELEVAKSREKITTPTSLGEKIQVAFITSINQMLEYLEKGIVYSVSVLPYLLIIGILYVGFKVLRRGNKKED